MTVISLHTVVGLLIGHLKAHHLNIDRPPSDQLSEAVLDDDIKQG